MATARNGMGCIMCLLTRVLWTSVVIEIILHPAHASQILEVKVTLHLLTRFNLFLAAMLFRAQMYISQDMQLCQVSAGLRLMPCTNEFPARLVDL